MYTDSTSSQTGHSELCKQMYHEISNKSLCFGTPDARVLTDPDKITYSPGNKGSHSSDKSQTISAVRTNCVASFRFTIELEVYLPTEVTSVSK